MSINHPGSKADRGTDFRLFVSVQIRQISIYDWHTLDQSFTIGGNLISIALKLHTRELRSCQVKCSYIVPSKIHIIYPFNSRCCQAVICHFVHKANQGFIIGTPIDVRNPLRSHLIKRDLHHVFRRKKKNLHLATVNHNRNVTIQCGFPVKIPGFKSIQDRNQFADLIFIQHDVVSCRNIPDGCLGPLDIIHLQSAENFRRCGFRNGIGEHG